MSYVEEVSGEMIIIEMALSYKKRVIIVGKWMEIVVVVVIIKEEEEEERE